MYSPGDSMSACDWWNDLNVRKRICKTLEPDRNYKVTSVCHPECVAFKMMQKYMNYVELYNPFGYYGIAEDIYYYFKSCTKLNNFLKENNITSEIEIKLTEGGNHKDKVLVEFVYVWADGLFEVKLEEK